MTYPVADEEQEVDAVLRAAAHGRWFELRKLRKPSKVERHDWIRAWLVGKQLRSSDDDVSRVDRLALTLSPEEAEEWARHSKFFDALDELQQKLDEVASTDFRKIG
ncbi:hypothetical protein [Reyranella soli]|uniref:Uncharacterized protein n=1 Tax=Reyranella soli TaxID=1230389 RepID=A0A512N8M8_9HYPH|nr:hypothetical protein [Reyranella soli]GEP55349.1 hypothetical protein RSO01_25150 [Reyranella soli]